MRTPKTNLENFVKVRQKLRRIGEILRGLANLRRSYPYRLLGRRTKWTRETNGLWLINPLNHRRCPNQRHQHFERAHALHIDMWYDFIGRVERILLHFPHITSFARLIWPATRRAPYKMQATVHALAPPM